MEPVLSETGQFRLLIKGLLSWILVYLYLSCPFRRFGLFDFADFFKAVSLALNWISEMIAISRSSLIWSNACLLVIDLVQ